jgi:23S rRNA (cytidine1920-2'-O)/16S rRNA (cytidine1409-2'-O)-methyltransferase
VLETAHANGLGTAGLLASPLAGLHGNREVLALLSATRGSDPAEWEDRLVRATGGDDGRHDDG